MNIGGVNSENHRSTFETTRAVLETEFHICMACIFSFKTIHMPILDQTLPWGWATGRGDDVIDVYKHM